MEISTESGLRADILKRVKSLATSTGETSTTSSSETIIRQVLIPANTWRQGEHINVRGGGFSLSSGGVINSFRVIARLGNTGVSSALVSDFLNNPGVNVPIWWFDFTLTHDIGSPDLSGIGGMFNQIGSVQNISIIRGEINVDFSVDNFFYLTAAVNGTGSPNFIVNETFQITKVPSQNF